MYEHRTALRLRVLSPVLLSQNNRQLNRPQSLSLTGFEGSRFDRWLRQGSGQHPLTGSPQHQWGFSFTQEPGDRLTACCSGALAVLFRSGQSPVVGHHYSPRHILLHQERGLGAIGAALSAFVSWLMWPSRNVIRSLALAICVRSSSTNAPSLPLARAGCGAVAMLSGMSINHWLPGLVPVSNPLDNLRLTVFGEIPKAVAASFIESCITQRINHQSYSKPVFSGNSLPRLPMLGKGGSTASVGALRRSSGLPAAQSITAQSLFSLKGNKSW